MKNLFVMIGCLVLAACGGSVQVVKNPPPVVQTYTGPAGYYTYENPSTGESGKLLLAPNGFFYSETSVPQCIMLQTGSITVASDNFTISGAEVSVEDQLADNFACTGNTNLTIGGDVIVGQELDFNTSDGGDIEWVYDPSTSQETASLTKIAGQYQTEDGTVLNINVDGTIDAQDSTTGCVISGTVVVPNSAVNVYAVTFTFNNCTGSSAILNGKTANGYYAYDYDNNLLFGGASLIYQGATYIVEGEVQKL
jgi:hypothetical protein